MIFFINSYVLTSLRLYILRQTRKTNAAIIINDIVNRTIRTELVPDSINKSQTKKIIRN